MREESWERWIFSTCERLAYIQNGECRASAARLDAVRIFEEGFEEAFEGVIEEEAGI
jgi:hypothetical protein